VLLEGDGRGGFSVIPSLRSGIRLEGEIRDIRTIHTPARTMLVVARNNDSFQFLRAK
jgi:hypothetical protein